MKTKLSVILLAIMTCSIIFILPKLCWAPPYNPPVYVNDHWDMTRTGPGQLIWALGNVFYYHAFEECSESFETDAGGNFTWGSEVDRKWAQFYNSLGVWDLGSAFSKVVVFPGQDHGPYPEEGVEHVIWGSNDFDINNPGSATWAVGHLDEVFVKGWSDVGEPPVPGPPANACNDDYTCLWSFEDGGSYRYVKLQSIWPYPYQEPEIDAVKGVISPAAIPALTNWGLIIFGVVLLGFITWVFLKRRKVIGVR